MLTLPPFKNAKDISAIQDLYFKIADYIPANKVSNIIASPFKTNTKIFHEILLKLNTLNDLDSNKFFRITAAETKELHKSEADSGLRSRQAKALFWKR